MCWHDLVSAQTSNVCITRHAAIAGMCQTICDATPWRLLQCEQKGWDRLNSDRAWSKYTKARNHLTSALRAAKAQYLENLSTTIRSPSDFWASYHKLSPKNQRISTDRKYNSFT